MLFFDQNEFSYRFIENLATGTTRKGGVYGRSWNHNRHVGRALRLGLLRHVQLSICLEVRGVIRRFIGILEFGLGPINLERTASEISLIRNFRANHLGSNLCPGAEA